MAREQRKLAAILFADVVGSSRLMGRDESGTVARLLEHLNRRLAPAAVRCGGRVSRLTGDGGLVEFGSAVDALRAAIEFQQAMIEANHDQPEDKAIVFRVGLHLGDVIVDGDDIYGDDVNVAARLEAEAPPGGIVVSRAVRDAVQGRLKVTLHPLGDLNLKNIVRPIRAFRVEWSAEDWPATDVMSGPASGAPASLQVAAGLTDARFVVSDKPSIAVLPFENMGGDPEQQYFVDGLVEDLTTALSRISSFFVIARNSSFVYKDRVVDVRQVGRELGARYVLEGSVRKAGNRLRITGQLVDAGTGNHIWANRYDGALEDVFHLQDSITSSVVAVTAPKVLQAEITRAQAKPTESLTAYDLFLRAFALAFEAKADSDVQALALLYRAIELDPNYSSAYGLIANLHWTRFMLHLTPLDEVKARGLEAARRAIETGQDNPHALASGGLGIALLGGRPEEGLPHLERALALNPNSNLVVRNAAVAFGMVGDYARGLALYERTMQLNPLDPGTFDTYFGIALLHFFAGRLEETLGWVNKSLGERPEYGPALCLKAAALASADRPRNEVQEVVQRLLTNAPGISIKVVRERMLGWRQVDVEAYSVGMRKAGFPE